MDSTYYRNNLSFLYETSDPKKNPAVYGTDQLLIAYTNSDTFNNVLSLNGFLRPINRVDILRESTADTSARASMLFQNASQTSLAQLPSSTSFSEEDLDNDVRIEINRPSTSTLSLDIVTSAITNEVQTRTPRSDVAATHASAQNYMRGVVSAVCGWQFKNAMDRVVSPNVQSSPESVRDAVFAISRGFSSRRKDMIFTVLTEACKNAMTKYIIDQLNTIPISSFTDLNEGLFVSPFYYRLRLETARELVIPQNLLPIGIDDFTLRYFKNILVDLYIKTSYPLVHYDFIDALMQRYTENGDFVNSRVALLAKIMFVNHFVDAVVMATTASTGGSIVNPNIPPVIDAIKTTLNNYVTTLNTAYADSVVQGTGTKDPRVAIMRRLQNMSSKVTQDNKTASEVHNNVVQHQITLRNLETNSKNLKNVRSKKLLEFGLLSSALVAVVVACGVFIVIKKTDWALYLSSAWILILLLIASLDFTKSFLK